MGPGEEGQGEKPDRPLSAIGIGVVAAVLVIDQIAKALAEAHLDFEAPVTLLPVLSLYRVHNTGIAFSLLGGFGNLGLVAVTLAITVIVLGFWLKAAEGGRMAAIGYALIIGGAVGNLVDRLVHGHVVDFLFLHLGDRPLFVFNLADAALTLGPCLLILAHLLPAKRRPPPRG